MPDSQTPAALSIRLDRTAALPIGDQIYASLRQAILDGRLAPGGDCRLAGCSRRSLASRAAPYAWHTIV